MKNIAAIARTKRKTGVLKKRKGKESEKKKPYAQPDRSLLSSIPTIRLMFPP
jgi:hypothetical protein